MLTTYLEPLLNSAYGAFGNEHFRMYSLDIAEGITISGQVASRWVAQELEKYLDKITKSEGNQWLIYGDTDSLYLSLEKIVNSNPKLKDKSTKQKVDFLNKFVSEFIEPEIEKIYARLAEYTNAFENQMVMKLETTCERGVFVAKKKYALLVHSSEGVEYEIPKLKITGLEAIKSSTPEKCREVLKECYRLALETKNESKVQERIQKFKEEWNSLSPDEIALSTSVSKVSDYLNKDGSIVKGTPIQSRAAINHNQLCQTLGLGGIKEISDGDKIKYVYLKEPNPIRSNVFGFSRHLDKRFNLDKYVDYDLMFQKSFGSAVDTFLESVKWTKEKVVGLGSFF